MRVPTSVKILGFPVRIEYPDTIPGDTAEEGDLSGDCQVQSRRIRVSKTQNTTPDAVLQTVWHEMIHMAIGLAGHSDMLKRGQEEGIVLALEHALGPLLLLNPAAPIRWRQIDFPD